MTKNEIQNMSEWTMQLWRIYVKYLKMEMQNNDFDALIEELRAIWEASDRDELIADMCTAFASDLDRRAANAEQ